MIRRSEYSQLRNSMSPTFLPVVYRTCRKRTYFWIRVFSGSNSSMPVLLRILVQSMVITWKAQNEVEMESIPVEGGCIHKLYLRFRISDLKKASIPVFPSCLLPRLTTSPFDYCIVICISETIECRYGRRWRWCVLLSRYRYRRISGMSYSTQLAFHSQA